MTLAHVLQDSFVLLLTVAPPVWLVRRILVDRRGWSTRMRGPVDPHNLPPRRHLDEIRDHDPDFSVVLFEDFVRHLVAQAHIARADPVLRDAVRPYLRDDPRSTLARLGDTAVTDALVGPLRIHAFARDGKRWRVTVGFDAIHVEPARTRHTHERWTLSRRQDLRSRPPERTRSLGCPNCGAPSAAMLGATCRECDHTIDTGEFDWIVEHIELIDRPVHPPSPPPAAPATPWGTVYDTHARVAWRSLLHKDPTLSARVLGDRVAHVFHALQRARASGVWQDAREVLGDALHHAHAHGLAAGHDARAPAPDARITNLEVVRCASDRWYDAITVRLHTTGAHSTYWTLIRGRAVERDDATCPRCSAALELTGAGDCVRCGAHVATAAADWILTRSERDADYRG